MIGVGAATPVPTADVSEIFGMRSVLVRNALCVFGAIAFAVAVHASWALVAPWQWALLGLSAVFFGAAGYAVVRIHADPIPMSSALLIAAATLAGVALGFWGISEPTVLVMQTGPPTGSSVIILAYLAVRGRVLVAWATSIVITVIVASWGVLTGHGAAYGALLTVPGYAVMIMGSLFAIMLRPMARDIIALRESRERQVAADAAARAAEDVRRVQAQRFARRARPILEAVARRDEFSPAQVREARLIEAQLRDGIRARALDVPEIRDAAWQARARGVRVVLLDDGGLDAIDGARRGEVLDRVIDVVVAELAQRDSGRVVVRILPAGRGMVASISVAGESHREFDDTGNESIDSMLAGRVSTGETDLAESRPERAVNPRGGTDTAVRPTTGGENNQS